MTAVDRSAGEPPIPRVFISYAHASNAHVEAVRDLWVFLRSQRIDARLDLPAAERRQDWPVWMLREVRAADFVLVVASNEYRRRAEGDAAPDEGRGVQFEAQLIREEVYRDREAALTKFLPIVLDDASTGDIPVFLGPATATSYRLPELTLSACEPLLRVLTGQPWEVEVPLGDRSPVFPSRDAQGPAPSQRPALRHDVTFEVTRDDNTASCRVMLAGTLLGTSEAILPVGIDQVWRALAYSPAEADERLLEAGHGLRRALLDDQTVTRLVTLVDLTPLGTVIDVTFEADDAALGLPFELLRLPDGRLLATVPGVRMRRQGRDFSRQDGTSLPGPMKILVAVGAPDETRTASAPLDVEAEMQTILDAVTDSDLQGGAQVRILEVASPEEITAALRADQYHVLHLSAHGSSTGVELEDEDGNAVPVGIPDLVHCLRAGGRPLPLVVLSSCAGAGEGGEGLAAALVRRGAGRVLAMQAPVTDRYATALARGLYQHLSTDGTLSVAGALAEARRELDDQRAVVRRTGTEVPPESAVPTLISRDDDLPLVDMRAEPQPLPRPDRGFSGGDVRRLRIGELIGRRRQLRTALTALRGGPEARERFGALAGVVLTGVGGIGKTALAGRIEGRLHGEGWLTAVHSGVWDPPALNAAVAAALASAGAELRRDRALLLDARVDDATKFHLVCSLLGRVRLLLLFDDFEQNLDLDGRFRDPGFADSFETLLQAATNGQVLVTSRYPILETRPFLLEIPLPPLSTAELQRMLLRLPALRNIDREERRALVRTIGGHPRLLEFLNALLRNGRGNLHEVTTKLRALARAQSITSGPMPFAQALDETIVLGSRDILLDHLLEAIDEEERELLLQAEVSRVPLSLADLAVARWGSTPTREQRETTTAMAARLQDLTLLSSVGERDVLVHPWIGQSLRRNDLGDEVTRHNRAFDMRLARINSGPADLADLTECCRHLAGADRSGDLVRFALEATAVIERHLGELSVAAFCGEVIPTIDTGAAGYLLLADREAVALTRTGHLRAAAARVEQHVHIARARAEADPSGLVAQRNLSVAYNKQGDLARACGESTQAEQRYRDSLDIIMQLVETYPDKPDLQRDVSICYDRLGDLARDRGDSAQAEQLYRDSLDIAKRLADADPDDTELQRDLALSYDRLGDLASRRGESTEAERFHGDSLDIIKHLADADPADAELQRDLAVAHNRLGDLAWNRGDGAAAEQLFRDSLDIIKRLTDTDPDNTEFRRDLTVIYNRLGDLARDRGDKAGAEQLFRDSLDIVKRLADADAANTQLQRDLSISYDRLGDLARDRGDNASAEQLFRDSLDIAEHLAAADPANAQLQRDVAVYYNRLGDLARARGDNASAEQLFRDGLNIIQHLVSADPANTMLQRDVTISYNKLGDLARDNGDIDVAEQLYRDNLDIRRRLADADPTNRQLRLDLAVAYARLSDLAGDSSAPSGDDPPDAPS
jgi:tetratricopeptide (TPR) repeat protein